MSEQELAFNKTIVGLMVGWSQQIPNTCWCPQSYRSTWKTCSIHHAITNDYRITWLQEYRNTGLQEYRNTGKQDYRNTGIQEYILNDYPPHIYSHNYFYFTLMIAQPVELAWQPVWNLHQIRSCTVISDVKCVLNQGRLLVRLIWTRWTKRLSLRLNDLNWWFSLFSIVQQWYGWYIWYFPFLYASDFKEN